MVSKQWLAKEGNRKKWNAYTRKWRAEHKEILHANYLKNAERYRQYHHADYEARKAYYRAQAKTRYLKFRTAVLEYYGGSPPRCACCGVMDYVFLTIDHIHDNGAEERRAIFGVRNMAGAKFYAWLVKRGFPEGYQVLCFNCNYAKSHGGCPHKHGLKSRLERLNLTKYPKEPDF